MANIEIHDLFPLAPALHKNNPINSLPMAYGYCRVIFINAAVLHAVSQADIHITIDYYSDNADYYEVRRIVEVEKPLHPLSFSAFSIIKLQERINHKYTH